MVHIIVPFSHKTWTKNDWYSQTSAVLVTSDILKAYMFDKMVKA
jgi:hypothetical protein